VQIVCIWSTAFQNPIVSCLIKIKAGCTFLVLACQGCPEKEAVKWVYSSSSNSKVSGLFVRVLFVRYLLVFIFTLILCSMQWALLCTGWHRINWTIQPFNRVYENLHKITPLTLVAHRQIRRQERNLQSTTTGCLPSSSHWK